MITPSTVQLLKHPGPVSPTRRDVMAGRNQKTYRFTLRRGASLYDSVASAIAATGVNAAALNIERAVFSRLRYFLITTTPDFHQVAPSPTPPEPERPPIPS